MTQRLVPLALGASLILAGCPTEPERAREVPLALSPEAAADELVGLVLASPEALPGGELDRLGELLVERSDRERLLAHLHERSLAHPDDANLAAWLARLEDDERATVRGVDVIGS